MGRKGGTGNVLSECFQLLSHGNVDLDGVGDPHGIRDELLALDDDLAVVGAGTVATMAAAAALGRVEVDGDDVDCVELWCRRRYRDGWGRRRWRELKDWRGRGRQLEHRGRWRRESDDGRRGHFDVDGRGRARRRHDGGDGAVDGGVARKLGLEIEACFGPSGSLTLVGSHWGCVSRRVSQSMEVEWTHSCRLLGELESTSSCFPEGVRNAFDRLSNVKIFRPSCLRTYQIRQICRARGYNFAKVKS